MNISQIAIKRPVFTVMVTMAMMATSARWAKRATERWRTVWPPKSARSLSPPPKRVPEPAAGSRTAK